MPLSPLQQKLLAYLRDHLDAHGYPPSQVEIAAHLGLKQNRSARLHLEALARAGEIELVSGRARGIQLRERTPAPSMLPASMLPASMLPASMLPASMLPASILHVPLLGRVAAGRPMASATEASAHIALDPALFRLRPDYLLEVVGESMILDGILPHDLIGVHRTAEARHGQTVVARVEGEFTVKRLDRKGAHIRLLPRNPAYAPIEVDPRGDFAIEGLFAGLLRRG